MDEIDGDYDLEVLLEVRQNEYDDAERRYQEELKAQRELEQKVQRLKSEVRQQVQERKRRCRDFDRAVADGNRTMGEIQNFDHYVARLRKLEDETQTRLSTARNKLRRITRTMESAHDEMLDALRQLKAVEKHYEDWQEERDAKQQRRRSAKMDDVAARMWRQNR